MATKNMASGWLGGTTIGRLPLKGAYREKWPRIAVAAAKGTGAVVARTTRSQGSEEICRFLANLFADVANRGELGFIPLCQLLFLHLINMRQLHQRALPTTSSFMRVAVVWPVANIFSLHAGR
jgi:hypothetical protein